MPNDFVAAVAWSSTNCLLLAASWKACGRLFAGDGFSARVLHTVVLGWGVIVGVSLLLGSIGILTPVALLACGAAVAGILWVLSRGVPGARPAGLADSYGASLCGLLLIGLSGQIVLRGLLQFPTDWDTLMYHLPLVDQWLQARSLYAPRDATWFNPGNNELIGLWLVAPFSGDFLIALNNLPAVSVLVLAGVELGRELGLHRPLALVGGLTLTANYVVLRQLTDAENDVAVAGFFLAGLTYVLRYAAAGRRADLAFAALTLGLLAGVKYYALGYGAVLGASLVAVAWRAHGRRAAAGALAAGLLGALLLGGYWYIRNAWLTGTPTYPQGFTAATDYLSQNPDWRDGLWGTTFFGSGRPEVAWLALVAVQAMTGPCHLLALASVPTTAAWLLLGGLWRPASEQLARAAAALALLGAGIVWGITPWAIETVPGTLNMLRNQYLPVRFGLSFLSLSVLVFIVALQDLGEALQRAGGRWLGAVPGALLATTAVYQFRRQAATALVPADVPTVCLIGVGVLVPCLVLALCVRRWPDASRRLLGVTAAVVLAGFCWACGPLAERWHEGFVPFYDRFFKTDTFSRLAEREPAEARICVLNYRYYPFLGSRRQFTVARAPWHLTCDSLQCYLKAHDLNVAVACAHDPFPNGKYRYQINWLAERPERYRKVAAGAAFVVYEIKRTCIIFGAK